MIFRFFIGIGRHIRDAFRNFFRNFGLSLSALASINVTLIVVSFSILLGANFDQFASRIENDVTIVAQINNEVSDEEVAALESDLNRDKRVESIEFSSKDDELNLIIESMDGMDQIAEQYRGEENPLFRVFYIKAIDVEEIKGLVKDMEASGVYFQVNYSSEVVDKVVNLFYYARVIAVIIIMLLLLVTVFIIFNTIRITIHTRSVQVEIMKLIGASNYHITMPYIYEGVLIGLFGSLVPILITTFGYKYFYDEYANSSFIKSYITLVDPYPLVIYIGAGLLAVGIFVGVIGSAFSIRRFVRK